VRLYLARHGETTWNLIGRYQGRRESALSARGMQQGFALAEAFAHVRPRVERIVASPLHRTRATAQFVADRLNLAVETDDLLLEIEHGTWNGRLRDEIAANEPILYRIWRERPAEVSFTDGESLATVLTRWRRFRDTFRAEVPTLAVTHDAVIRVALCDIMGRPLDDFWSTRVENAGYAIVEIAPDGSWTLVEESVHDHLGALRAEVAAQAL
jgi:broad specificity phosphatase PhoE